MNRGLPDFESFVARDTEHIKQGSKRGSMAELPSLLSECCFSSLESALNYEKVVVSYSSDALSNAGHPSFTHQRADAGVWCNLNSRY